MREFNFSLPRLLAAPPGRKHFRSERNGTEARLAGGFNHLVVFACIFHLLTARVSLTTALLLLLPIAVLVWIFWLLLLYLNSWIIYFGRKAGFAQALPDNRAQTALITGLTSAMAVYLLFTPSFLRWLGAAWLLLVALNLLAAALLALTAHDRSAKS